MNNDKFGEAFIVQHLTSKQFDKTAHVCISTLQRMYSMPKGRDLPDEAHRSTYNLWRQVLEYFDAHLIGLNVTPNKQTLGFFERRHSLLEGRFETWARFSAFLVAVAIRSGPASSGPCHPQPWLQTACAAAMLCFTAWRCWGMRREMRHSRQGIDGRKAVGPFLGRLRSEGRQGSHDVVGEGFNVDPVLIGPAGVFTVGAKTWSKPVRGDARIKEDGRALTVAGRGLAFSGSSEPRKATMCRPTAPRKSWL